MALHATAAGHVANGGCNLKRLPLRSTGSGRGALSLRRAGSGSRGGWRNRGKRRNPKSPHQGLLPDPRSHEHACHIRWIVLGPNVNAGVSSHVGVGVDRPTCPPARIERHIASVDAGWAHAFKFAYLRRVLGPPRRLLSRLQNLGPGWQAPRLLIREVTFSSQLLVDWEGRDPIGFPRSRAGRRCDC